MKKIAQCDFCVKIEYHCQVLCLYDINLINNVYIMYKHIAWNREGEMRVCRQGALWE